MVGNGIPGPVYCTGMGGSLGKTTRVARLGGPSVPVWIPDDNRNNNILPKERKEPKEPKEHLNPFRLLGADGLCDEVRGQAQRFKRPSIGPPAFKNAVAEQTFFKVTVVEVGDFQLSAA